MEPTYENFDAIAALMGITVTDKRFSGFWSQGDGASFEGHWTACNADYLEKVKEYAPTDEKLHSIAADLQKLQEENRKALYADISYLPSRYVHANTMVTDTKIAQRDNEGINDDSQVSEELEKQVKEIMRALANWLYAQLESNHDALQSDENVTDNIIGNEYAFTEDGKRFD